MSRTNTIARTRRAVAEIPRQQGYVSAVDVMLHIGMLAKADYESWRAGRVQYLEKVTCGSLSTASVVVRSMRAACLEYGLKESRTEYRKWGKGFKPQLRFSKSGDPAIERAIRCCGGCQDQESQLGMPRTVSRSTPSFAPFSRMREKGRG